MVVVVVLTVGVTVWEVFSDRELEPTYEGRGLRLWLRDYTLGLNTGVEERVRARNRAESAVRKIGTNAIPTLLRMLSKEDSPATSRLVEFWNQHAYRLPRSIRYPSWYRHQAAFVSEDAARGFEILGPAAQAAVPALIKLYEQKVSSRSQSATASALNAIGPEAQRMAIPSFLRAAASSNAPVREVAVWALYGIDSQHQQVVPALIHSLSDTNFVIRLLAARSLGHFGTNAQQAVPALLRLLNDPSSRVRPDAIDALKKIDPETAAKVGAK